MKSIRLLYPELGFYAIIDGEKKDAVQLINEEYEIMNDAGMKFEYYFAFMLKINGLNMLMP